jgi:hypothetical protein
MIIYWCQEGTPLDKWSESFGIQDHQNLMHRNGGGEVGKRFLKKVAIFQKSLLTNHKRCDTIKEQKGKARLLDSGEIVCNNRAMPKRFESALANLKKVLDKSQKM